MMEFQGMIFAVLLSQLVFSSTADGADIHMVVNSATKVLVDKDLSSTYGMKFCMTSDQGIVFTLTHTKGVYDPYTRAVFEIGKVLPDVSNIKYLASSSAGARNYETDVISTTQSICFWMTWADNWYFIGKGNWGEHLLMNYRNTSQSSFGGVYVNTRNSGTADLTIIDENISKADAQTYAANSLAVPQTFAGPVVNPNDVNAPTSKTETTTSGADYKVVNINLGAFNFFSYSVTTNDRLFGGYLLLCNSNIAGTDSCYEFNLYRYQFLFYVAKGINNPKVTNVNGFGYSPFANGTAKTAWISWGNGRIVCGMGDMTGVDPVVAFYDPNLTNGIDTVKIKSPDMDSNWTFATRYYASK